MGLKVDTDTLMTKNAQEGRVRIPNEMVETVVDCAINVAHDIFREEIDYAIGNYLADMEKRGDFAKYEYYLNGRNIDDRGDYICKMLDNHSKIDFVEMIDCFYKDDYDVIKKYPIDVVEIGGYTVYTYDDVPKDVFKNVKKALKVFSDITKKNDKSEAHLYYSHDDECYKILKLVFLDSFDEFDMVGESFYSAAKISKKLVTVGVSDIKITDYYTDECGMNEFLFKFSI